jgi:hypothetical protein
MKTPNPMPHLVCWATDARSEVMNTMALDVRPEVFAATHYPSLVLEGTGAKDPTARVDERAYVDAFLKQAEPHVLDVAVGDSGTGKSHFIRWVHHAVMHSPRRAGLCVKLIPRSSANLADIVLELVKEFRGEAIDQLRKELEQSQSRTTLAGAADRVLDEHAFVLDPATREGVEVRVPADVDTDLYRDVLGVLPAFLRDDAIRRWFQSRPGSVVMALAKHVTSRRDNREDLDDLADRLAWKAADLEVPPQVQARAGAAAKELSSVLLNDDAARNTAARILRDAFGEVSNGLLGLKRGDLQRAIVEIRRQLKSEGKELVLLIEDMSVTHGLDRDLLEALIVRTRDAGGGEICKLRALIGVTNTDYNSMADNIRGRIRRTLSFSVRFGNLDTDQSQGAEIGRDELVDFASRYLNAVRYGLADLQKWLASRENNEDLPSFCVQSGCPNRSECHAAFGNYSDRGLYPFTQQTLIRLYQQSLARLARREGGVAFNPRLMVSAVLDDLLRRAEDEIPDARFPSRSIAEWHRLADVGAAIRDAVQQSYRADPATADRLLTGLELYSERPAEGAVKQGILAAFALPILGPVKAKRPEPISKHETPPPPPDSDEFDRWAGGENLSQDLLNKWRTYVYAAVAGHIDWDEPGLAAVGERFKSRYINFEGQLTTRAVGGTVVLDIRRSPQTALALRGLKTGFQTEDRLQGLRMLELAARLVRAWAHEVKRQLRTAFDTSQTGSLAHATEYLALGAVIRGRLQANTPDADALAMTLSSWPVNGDEIGSPPWQQLHRAYRDHGAAVRDWIVAQVSCRKGARVGDFIDPTALLPSIRSVRKAAEISPASVEATASGALPGAAAKLSEALASLLPQTLDAERGQATAWKHAVDQLLAGASLTDVAKRLRRSVEAAAAIDVLGTDTAAAFVAQCNRFAQKGTVFDQCYQATSLIRADTPPGELLRCLAKLDRAFMADLLPFLHEAQSHCERALNRIRNEAASIPALDDLQHKISEQLATLQSLLRQLHE